MSAFTSSRLAQVIALAVVAAGFAGVACSAPAEEAEESNGAMTGGSSGSESPAVFFFDTAAESASAKCGGALISNKYAVTAKSCAKVGQTVGRAEDKNGKGVRAKVKAVHVPDEADAEIAVVELDEPIKGLYALVTNMPLRPAYTVAGMATKSEEGFLGLGGVDKGTAASLKGNMTEENGTHGLLTPNKGTQICEGDIGAPVCSTSSTRILGRDWSTCGLSGIVVGQAGAKVDADGKATAGAECSEKQWKVAPLGRHAAFLKKYAPETFKPIVPEGFLGEITPIVPDGLWGYKSKADVASCTVETKTLSAIKPELPSSLLKAKVKFANVELNATPFGRWGIAPKSDPKNVRWLPARMIGVKAASFEGRFEGVVRSMEEGDYLVTFRVSNGGEKWTDCAMSAPLELKVAKTASEQPSVPGGGGPTGDAGTTPETDAGTIDTDAGTTTEPQSDTSDSYSDPPADDSSSTSGDDSSEDGSGDGTSTTKKKKAADSGCSTSGGGFGSSTAVPALGALLGLAFLGRRRRTAK